MLHETIWTRENLEPGRRSGKTPDEKISGSPRRVTWFLRKIRRNKAQGALLLHCNTCQACADLQPRTPQWLSAKARTNTTSLKHWEGPLTIIHKYSPRSCAQLETWLDLQWSWILRVGTLLGAVCVMLTSVTLCLALNLAHAKCQKH